MQIADCKFIVEINEQFAMSNLQWPENEKGHHPYRMMAPDSL